MSSIHRIPPAVTHVRHSVALSANPLIWYQTDLITIPHAMFTRHGGSGRPPFHSLNLSYHVGDDPAAVAHNRQLVKNILNIKQLASATQIHGDYVATIRGHAGEDIHVEGCDALITAEPGIGLLIQQADCQAILLHDPGKKVIGAIHCGWRGSVLNLIATTIGRMRAQFGVKPADLHAAISPALGPCCAEFINYHTELPHELHGYHDGTNHFNFWHISRDQLLAAGVTPKKIRISEMCTCCDNAFFSYRRARKAGREMTGRMGSVIALPRT